jgi:hypothetical protein
MSDDIGQKPMEPVAHQHNGLVSLHPAVYHIFIALAVLFVVGAWSFFGAGKYAAIVMVVVTLFVGFAIGIVTDLAHIWRDHHDLSEDPGEPTESFHEWLRSPVKIQWGTISGKHAFTAAVLPVAAGGIGMALLAIAHAIAVG